MERINVPWKTPTPQLSTHHNKITKAKNRIVLVFISKSFSRKEAKWKWNFFLQSSESQKAQNPKTFPRERVCALIGNFFQCSFLSYFVRPGKSGSILGRSAPKRPSVTEAEWRTFLRWKTEQKIKMISLQKFDSTKDKTYSNLTQIWIKLTQNWTKINFKNQMLIAGIKNALLKLW